VAGRCFVGAHANASPRSFSLFERSAVPQLRRADDKEDNGDTGGSSRVSVPGRKEMREEGVTHRAQPKQSASD